VQLLIGGCSILFIVSVVLSPGALQPRGLMSLFAPDTRTLFLLGASGALPVYGLGHVWTLLSASWLHGGLLHIFFNMMWVRQLAGPVAELYGAGRMILIWTAASIVGFGLSSTASAFLPAIPFLGSHAPFTVGASASIFGLLGALVCYGRQTGQHAMRQQVWTWAVVMFIFGAIMPGVDNFAHAGGFVGGYCAAHLLNPLKPERTTHMLWALVCLALTAVSIVLSIVTGAQLLRAIEGV
jgi:rhomboid protease GluP